MLKKSMILLAIIAALLFGNAAAYAYLYGVDVSSHQGTINWTAVKGAKDFALIKATEGCNWADPQWTTNRSGCRASGILRGFYHYARPDLGNTGTWEADSFVNLVGALQPGELLMLDYEPEQSTAGYDNPQAVAWCKEWLDRVFSRTGVKPMIYLYTWMINHYDWTPVINAGYPVNYAYVDYNPLPTTPKPPQWPAAIIKQYDWYNNTCPGFQYYPVDLDTFDGDANDWVGLAGAAPRWCPAWGQCARTSDNKIMAFFNCPDGTIRDTHQVAADGSWISVFDNLGGNNPGTPSCGIGESGYIELFVRGADGKLWHTWQNAAPSTDSWGAWGSLGSYNSVSLTGNPAIMQAIDRRMEVFAVNTNGELTHIYQTVIDGGWSSWMSHGKPAGVNLVGSPFAANAADRKIEVFVRGSDANVWHIWQTVPNGGMGSWENLSNGGSAISSDITSALSQDGRIEIFALAADHNIWHRAQTAPNSGWTSWDNLGTPAGIALAAGPKACNQQNNAIQLFCAGSDGNIWHKWQTAANGPWSGWENLGGGNYASDLCVSRSNAQKVEIFYRRTDGRVSHLWQTAVNGGWSSWTDMGNPIPIPPPSAPTNLAATSTATSVHLSWTAATANDSSGIANYEIDRDGTAIATIPATSTTYDDSGLSMNTAYTYTVRAKSGNQEWGPFSSGVTVTTWAVPTAPANLKASPIGTVTVRLTWNASTVVDGSRISQYEISRNGTVIATIAGTSTSTYDTAVTAGISYTYAVRAKSGTGVWGPPSSVTLTLSAPSVDSVSVTPPMVAVGDTVHVVVTASDANGITSVTANDTALTLSGSAWVGDIAADTALDIHPVTIIVTGVEKLTATDASATYRTAQVFAVTGKAVADTIMNNASALFLFRLWGTLVEIDDNNFTLNDGSTATPIRIHAPGYKAKVGGGGKASARGILMISGGDRWIESDISFMTGYVDAASASK